MFLVFRQRGFDRNLTARTFRTSLRFEAKHNPLKSTELTNYGNDYDYNLFSDDIHN